MGVDTSHWIDYRTRVPLEFPRARVRPFPAAARFALDASSRASLLDAALSFRFDPYLSRDVEGFVAAARAACHAVVPAQFRSAVRTALDGGPGFALVEDLPVDPNLPATPVGGGGLPVGYKKSFVSEFCTAVLGSLCEAEIFNFRQEGRGSAPLFDNVVPVAALRSQRGAGGFANNFPFHCESAWHRKRPDYVVLMGIRPDTDAMTLVSSTVDIDPDTVDAMPVGGFQLKPPDLYLEMEDKGIPLGTPRYRVQDPVDPQSGDLAINFNGTECRGTRALDWLTHLERQVESIAYGCVLGTGNALILNNARTCHTRTGYSPVFDENSRWFLRGNFKRDLWAEVAVGLRGKVSAPHLEHMHGLGWVDQESRLTRDFLQYVEEPASVASLPGELRTLAEAALNHTPLEGSRIV